MNDHQSDNKVDNLLEEEEFLIDKEWIKMSIDELANAIKQTMKVKSLTMQYEDNPHKFENEEIDKILKAIQVNNSIKNFIFWCFDNNNVILVGDVMKFNKTITRLDIKSKGENIDVAIIYLGKCVQYNNTISKIDLGYCSLSTIAISSIGKFLETSRSITELDLQGNQIVDSGVVSIAKGLIHQNSIIVINLGWNQIGSLGAKFLGLGIKLNKSLKVLIIYQNKIGDEGAPHIAEGIRCNSNLTTLNISSNQIGDKGGKYLCEGFVNKTIKNISINTNQISNVCAKSIGKLINLNNSITGINAYDNMMNSIGFKLLIKEIKFSKSIRSLYCFNIWNKTKDNENAIQKLKLQVKLLEENNKKINNLP